MYEFLEDLKKYYPEILEEDPLNLPTPGPISALETEIVSYASEDYAFTEEENKRLKEAYAKYDAYKRDYPLHEDMSFLLYSNLGKGYVVIDEAIDCDLDSFSEEFQRELLDVLKHPINSNKPLGKLQPGDTIWVLELEDEEIFDTTLKEAEVIKAYALNEEFGYCSLYYFLKNEKYFAGPYECRIDHPEAGISMHDDPYHIIATSKDLFEVLW